MRKRNTEGDHSETAPPPPSPPCPADATLPMGTDLSPCSTYSRSWRSLATQSARLLLLRTPMVSTSTSGEAVGGSSRYLTSGQGAVTKRENRGSRRELGERGQAGIGEGEGREETTQTDERGRKGAKKQATRTYHHQVAGTRCAGAGEGGGGGGVGEGKQLLSFGARAAVVDSSNQGTVLPCPGRHIWEGIAFAWSGGRRPP